MRFKGNWLTRGHEVIVQKLSGRDTYTPTDVPQVRSNCGLLPNREETLIVAGLKLDGTKIHASAKAEDLQLLERANTLLMEVRRQFLPTLADGVFLPD